MSVPVPPTWLVDISANRFRSSYFNGDVDASQNIIIRNGNLYLAPNSNIYSTNNSMFFDDVYSFINFNQNIHVFGSLRFDYSAVEYDLGYELLSLLKPQVATNTTDIATNTTDISTLNSSISTINSSITTLNTKTTNITYTSGTNTTDFTGNLSFPATSINSAAILNNNFLALSGNQSCAGNKTFAGNIILSSTGNLNANGLLQALGSYLRVDGELRLGTNTITISQATLQKLQYLSTLASDVQTQINNSAKTNTTNTFSLAQTFSVAPTMSGANITAGTIPATALASSSFVDLSTNQTITTGIKTFSQPPVLSGASITAGTIPNSALATSYVDLSSTQLISGAKSFSSVLTASAGLVCNSITSLSNTALTTANSFITYLNSGKTSGDCRINSSSPNSNTYIDNGILYVGSPTTGTNFIISQPNSTVAGIYSGSLNNASITDYCEGIYLVNGAYGAEFQGGKIGTNTDVCNIGFHNNGTTMNFISAQNTTGTSITNPVVITGQTTIQGSLTLNNYNILNYQPLGTIIQNVSSSIGLPFLLCNGATISRTTYSTLFSLIGTSFGAGDGSTTFNIPNYQGVFLRGMGAQTQNSVVYSAGANPQTFQADALQDHNHNGQSGSYLGTSNVGTSINGWSPVASLKPQSFSFANTGGVNAGYRSSTETRPANYGVYYYIRAL